MYTAENVTMLDKRLAYLLELIFASCFYSLSHIHMQQNIAIKMLQLGKNQLSVFIKHVI